MGTYLKWRSYKEGPWAFSKSLADNRYNVGNKIVDSSNPVWNSDHSGVPITNRHIPCGYWTREYITEDDELIITPGELINPPVMEQIIWIPTGTPIGRFIGFSPVGPSCYMYKSDDGGETWTTVMTLPGHYWGYGSATYFHDLGVAIVNVATGTNGKTMMSSDGLTWSESPGYAASLVIRAIGYANGKFFAADSNNLTGSYVWTSSDGLNWVRDPYISPSQSFLGLFTYNNRAYFVSANSVSGVSFFWSDLVAPISLNFETGPWPYAGTIYRAQVGSNGSIYPYNKSFFAGGNWYPADINISYIDYNPTIKLFAATTKELLYRSRIYTSRNGLDWTEFSTASSISYDVAVGLDRIISVNNGAVNLSILLIS